MKKLNKLGIIAAALMTAGIVNAASDGNRVIGDNTIESTGTLDMVVEIPHVIRITGLTDIDFGQAAMDGNNLSVTRDFCVRSNDNVGFDIEFNSDRGTGTFVMEGDNNIELLPYTVGFRTLDTAQVESAQTIATEGVDITGITEQRRRPDCLVSGSTNNNGRLEIVVAAADQEDRSPDTYRDTLSVIVSPN